MVTSANATNIVSRGITRSIFRCVHIICGIPILGYMYDSPSDTHNYAPSVRYVFLPVLLLSGLWMWKGHVLRRLISKRSAKQNAAAKLLAQKRDNNWRHKDPMNPSQRIDQLIADLTDLRGKTLASIRKSILEVDREIIEEWKWMGSPVWSRDGMIAVGNALKDKVKLTFSNGASLPDPDKLFNAGLEGNKWRAIDLFEVDQINERALENLVRAGGGSLNRGFGDEPLGVL